jgi:hypothetical protein
MAAFVRIFAQKVAAEICTVQQFVKKHSQNTVLITL